MPEKSLDVLIVDDEPEVRELLSEHFRGRGCRVATSADGRAAIAAIQANPSEFGLIVTDLHMPGADGLAVLKAAREANPSAYVVIISGYASLDSAIQAVRLGAYDYLTKPFSLGQIDVLLRRVQDRMALEAENRRLQHRIDERDSGAPRQAPDRLAAIERRLTSIETAIRDLTVEVTRRRL